MQGTKQKLDQFVITLEIKTINMRDNWFVQINQNLFGNEASIGSIFSHGAGQEILLHFGIEYFF